MSRIEYRALNQECHLKNIDAQTNLCWINFRDSARPEYLYTPNMYINFYILHIHFLHLSILNNDN